MKIVNHGKDFLTFRKEMPISRSLDCLLVIFPAKVKYKKR